jgi:hypothetical protein
MAFRKEALRPKIYIPVGKQKINRAQPLKYPCQTLGISRCEDRKKGALKKADRAQVIVGQFRQEKVSIPLPNL